VDHAGEGGQGEFAPPGHRADPSQWGAGRRVSAFVGKPLSPERLRGEAGPSRRYPCTSWGSGELQYLRAGAGHPSFPRGLACLRAGGFRAVRPPGASIPKELFESEFFGHTKGAFTGAIRDRAGRFEAAAGGTLFLDEVGEIPLELQSKLLRVLQEKTYERVGEERTRRADVRIIAATNRDLKSEIAAGRFRADLYYRINVFPLRVPALRERKEDIALLATHFVALLVKELDCLPPRLTRAGIEALQSYHWGGNIRELRNVIERAVIMARGGALEFHLPVTSPSINLTPFEPPDDDAMTPEYLTESEIRRREREDLLAVLQKTAWKIKGSDGAAELLGIKANALIARIKKTGFQRPHERTPEGAK
jgi:transcriptional regulator with GAF, ATPase, and Fis domain